MAGRKPKPCHWFVWSLKALGIAEGRGNRERATEERGQNMTTNVEGVRLAAGQGGRQGAFVRLATETKQAFKTTEFWGMVVIVASILIASWVVDDGGGGSGDAFPAVRAWLYVAIVAAAYIVSRGLAKAGSREPYWAEPGDLPGGQKAD
jgi:hypothetical protein